MNDECIFCQIIRGDIPCEKILENDELVAFKDMVPVAPKHILIVPKSHLSSVVDLNGNKNPLGNKMMLFANKVAKNEDIDDAYRLVINKGKKAGQSVFHLHMHLLGGRKMSWPPG